jgi:hypothetical protein
MADDGNPRVFLGANNPPETTAREAIATHLADLLMEAHSWADGTTVESQAQADEASRLIDDLQKAAKAADDQRVVEKTPHDGAIKEIQDFWNLWIAPLTNKAPGRVPKAVVALKACVKPFLDKQEAARQEAIRKAQEEAQAAAKAAADAARAAQATDLAAQDAAEDLIRAAEKAQADAKRIENSRTQARGGERAMGLRKTFTPVMTDPKAAILHYMNRDKEAFIDLAQRLANEDVRYGLRSIPGFTIEQGTAL